MEKSYHDLYREGKHHVGYQPEADSLPESMHSFELYGSLENGMSDYPEIPKEKWVMYDFSGDKEPIEKPEFID